VGGHSQGATAAFDSVLRPGVRLILPFAPYSAVPRNGDALETVMYISGMSDGISSYTGTKSAYNSTRVKKRIVGITGGDHLDVTDLCEQNDDGQSGIQVANEHGVCNTTFLTILARCGRIDPALGPTITNYASAAQLEESLQCRDRTAAFENLRTKFPAVGEFLTE
jgi:hypothetical protein